MSTHLTIHGSFPCFSFVTHLLILSYNTVQESRLGATLIGPQYDQLNKFLFLPKAAPTISGRILNATFNAHSRLGHPSATVENKLEMLPNLWDCEFQIY